jgi:hypothetical protein
MASGVLVSDYIVLAVFGGLLLAFIVFLALRQWIKVRRARKNGGTGHANAQAPSQCCSGSLLRRFGRPSKADHPAPVRKNEFTLA